MSDDDNTPPYQEQPEHLPPAEVKRIERVLGRQPAGVHVALAERYRAEGADPLVVIAQVAIDVHDMKSPVSLAKKLAIGLASSSVAILLFTAYVVSNRTERDTAVEYRLRALEETIHRLVEIVERLDRIRPDFPVATAPPSAKGPPP